MFQFKEKECPFCDGGLRSDDQELFIKKCNHQFNLTYFNGQKQGVEDLKKDLQYQQKLIRKMEKIINQS